LTLLIVGPVDGHLERVGIVVMSIEDYTDEDIRLQNKYSGVERLAMDNLMMIMSRCGKSGRR
jgi:hypothetical protein